MLGIFTDHACARMQQRGIRPEALEALLAFGCERHLHSKGRALVFFDKAARARLLRDNPPPRATPGGFAVPTRCSGAMAR